MNILWQVVYLLLWFFRLLLLARIVVEIFRMFARQWRPVGRPAATMEILYVTTDPPIKLLRRVIPTVRIGGVGFDLSVFVIFIVVFILMEIAQSLALHAAGA